jgi:hypothetical protein
MITAAEIVGALVKCHVKGTNDYVDDSFLADTVFDGHFNLERAAKLLNRLERMRARRDAPTDRVWEKVRQLVRIPYKYGHGDVGDVIVSRARGELSDEEALCKLGYLEETYARVIRPT